MSERAGWLRRLLDRLPGYGETQELSIVPVEDGDDGGGGAREEFVEEGQTVAEAGRRPWWAEEEDGPGAVRGPGGETLALMAARRRRPQSAALPEGEGPDESREVAGAGTGMEAGRSGEAGVGPLAALETALDEAEPVRPDFGVGPVVEPNESALVSAATGAPAAGMEVPADGMEAPAAELRPLEPVTGTGRVRPRRPYSFQELMRGVELPPMTMVPAAMPEREAEPGPGSAPVEAIHGDVVHAVAGEMPVREAAFAEPVVEPIAKPVVKPVAEPVAEPFARAAEPEAGEPVQGEMERLGGVEAGDAVEAAEAEVLAGKGVVEAPAPEMADAPAPAVGVGEEEGRPLRVEPEERPSTADWSVLRNEHVLRMQESGMRLEPAAQGVAAGRVEAGEPLHEGLRGDPEERVETGAAGEGEGHPAGQRETGWAGSRETGTAGSRETLAAASRPRDTERDADAGVRSSGLSRRWTLLSRFEPEQ